MAPKELGEAHLLCADRKHIQVDAIEFIKATPKAALCKALVDFAHAFEVHLITAIEDNHILPERVAKVLQNKHHSEIVLLVRPSCRL